MDATIRELERAVAAGDEDAKQHLIRAKDRANLPLSLDELAIKMANLQTEIKEGGKRSLENSFKSFFEQHGHIVESFQWDQYTPYWNDGDRGSFSYYLFMDYEDYVELTEGTTEEVFYAGGKSEVYKALQEIDKFLSKHEDLLHMIFGDDATVKVTANGITRHENTGHG